MEGKRTATGKTEKTVQFENSPDSVIMKEKVCGAMWKRDPSGIQVEGQKAHPPPL